jgi:hypothetical protein
MRAGLQIRGVCMGSERQERQLMPAWPRTAAMAAIKTSPTKNQVIALSVTLSTDKVRLRDM